MTMTNKEVREHAARRVLTVALLRKCPKLTDEALEKLLVAGANSLQWREAVLGTEDFKVQECVAACTEAAGFIFDYFDDDDDDTSGSMDHAKAVEGLKPAAQINYARKHGLP